MQKKKSMILYPINIESEPNWVIRKAFTKAFDPFEEYDWVNIRDKIGLDITQWNFLHKLREGKYEYCFMQLQNPGNMNVEMIRMMSQHTKIINWCGDVRQNKEWYDWFIAIGKEIFLTLWTNETDVEIMRKAGVRADYLQVGFDNEWYKKHLHVMGWPEIVYCANHYGTFQLSEYRKKVVQTLNEAFGSRFKLFGSGWRLDGITATPITNQLEAQAYNSCKIAMSVSNFHHERYYSDRLLRIMACQAFPLSHEFNGLEKDFTVGENIQTFKNMNDLVDKCNYYLTHGDERRRIAKNAHDYVHTNCTWDVRCNELVELLDKYDQQFQNVIITAKAS